MDLDTEFELIGILIGLAIYNGHILEFQFPLVLYKKLMGQSVGLDDLQELQPEVYSSLNKLMEMSEEELQQLALTFQVGWCTCGVGDMSGRSCYLRWGVQDTLITVHHCSWDLAP